MPAHSPLCIFSCGRPSVSSERERVTADLAEGLGAGRMSGGRLRLMLASVMGRFHGTRRIILTTRRGRCVVSLMARLLGMRVYWIEWPSAQRLHGGRLAHGIICWSNEAAGRLRAQRYPSERIAILPLPIHPSRFSQQLSVYDELADRSYQQGLSLCYVIGIIAPLVRDSGIERLLTAVRGLTELMPHLQVIIVGEGPEKKRLQWLSQMLGINNRVRFVGGRGAPERWYRFFSVTYVPGGIDTTGLRLAESLYAGVPVLAVRAEGAAELLQDGDRWTVPGTESAEHLAEALSACEREAGIARQHTEVAQQRLRSEHDAQAVADRLKFFMEK